MIHYCHIDIYENSDGAFAPYYCDEERNPYRIGPLENGLYSTRPWFFLRCPIVHESGPCGGNVVIQAKTEGETIREERLKCNRCGADLGLIPNGEQFWARSKTSHEIIELLERYADEPMPEIKKEKIRELVEDQWMPDEQVAPPGPSEPVSDVEWILGARKETLAWMARLDPHTDWGTNLLLHNILSTLDELYCDEMKNKK